MTAPAPVKTVHPPCSAPDCTTPRRSSRAQWCEKHYYRIRRNGTLDAKTQRPHKGTCTIEGCHKEDCGPHGMCMMHYTRTKRHGSPYVVLKTGVKTVEDHPKYKGDDVGYSGAHMRVKAVKGSASAHSCIDCGSQAKHWSYNHNGRHENEWEGIHYGVDVSDYEPRCVPCHKAFDLEIIRSTSRTVEQ